MPYPYRKLTTSEDHAVVRPNVDTLYTPLFYDISQEDLEFEIPEIDDRYWLWPWYDMYGNNFSNISMYLILLLCVDIPVAHDVQVVFKGSSQGST